MYHIASMNGTGEMVRCAKELVTLALEILPRVAFVVAAVAHYPLPFGRPYWRVSSNANK